MRALALMLGILSAGCHLLLPMSASTSGGTPDLPADRQRFGEARASEGVADRGATGDASCQPPAPWAVSVGSPADEGPPRLGIDGKGNLYLGLTVAGKTTLRGSQVQARIHLPYGPNDFVVASFTPDGAYRWSNIYGTSGGEILGALSVDVDGNVTLAGQYRSSGLQIGATPLPDASSGSGLFLIGLDTQGKPRWARGFVSPTLAEARALASSPAGVALGGAAMGSLDLGLGPPLSAGGLFGFVALVDPLTGQPKWAELTNAGGIQSVAIGHNALVATGSFPSALTIQGRTLAAPKEINDVFVAAFELGSGSLRWLSGLDSPVYAPTARVAGGETRFFIVAETGIGPITPTVVGLSPTDGAMTPFALLPNAPCNQSIALATVPGELRVASAFPGNPPTSAGFDFQVTRVDPASGAKGNQITLGGAANELVNGLALGPCGWLAVAGTFDVKTTIVEPLENMGLSDGFLMVQPR